MTRPGLEVPEGAGLDVLGSDSEDVFDLLSSMGHEQVVYSHDPSCGYRSIIAVHDTTLGPSLGGTRFWTLPTTSSTRAD